MDTDTAVLVVGGGVTGTGVARDLAMRGVDVTLVERGALAGGTTGRSHGLLHSGARYAVDDPASARACIAENRVLREIAPNCVDPTGGYVVQLAEDSPAYFEETVAACRDADIPVEVRSGATVRSEAPSLSSAVERAVRVPDGVVNPVRLAAANAADASVRGARIETGTAVVDLLVEGGRVTGATVERAEETETIRADHVVNAAGAWAGQLASMAGAEVEMRPAKGAMVVTETPSVDVVVNRCRPADDGDIVVPCDGFAVVGTTSVEVDDPDEFPREEWERDRLLAEGAKLIPAVGDAPVVRSYWGVRPLYEPASEPTPNRIVESGGEPADKNEEIGDARGVSRDFFLFDHADRDGLAGFSTVVGGKATTYRRMAEATADHVAAALGVDEPCRTAEVALLATTDATLDELVGEFAVASPPVGTLFPPA